MFLKIYFKICLFRFSYLSNPHEEITLEPGAAKFLFSPTKQYISVGSLYIIYMIQG